MKIFVPENPMPRQGKLAEDLRVYFIDSDVYDDDDNHPTSLSDKEFVKKSYKNMYIEEFVDYYNNSEVTMDFIRII